MSTRIYFGFSSANIINEPAWFCTAEAARRFGQACGWEAFDIETSNDVDSEDIMDTPDAPWAFASPPSA